MSFVDISHASFEQAIAQSYSLRRGAKPVVAGKVGPGRTRRYVMLMLPAVLAVWVLTAMYIFAAPVTYKSEFTLILPGAGAASSLNLDSIGQAQNSSASAFASPTLSPTENYKQLITADVTLRDAERIAEVPVGKFPAPTIKLVDQTNLIQITVTGRTAIGARKNADALRQAFLDRLEHLRADEATKREEQDVKHLAALSAKERLAEGKLIDFQARHGLATLDQFNQRIAAVTGLKDKERDLRLALRQQSGESGRLAASLKTDRHLANQAWRLHGDPVFQELASQYAKSNADAELKSGTLGPGHGVMAQANAERGRLRAALLKRGRQITQMSQSEVMGAIDITLADGRSALMQTMDVGDAQAAGTANALSELRGDIAREQAKTPELIEQAQQLADLQRDQRVAAAVFSSALARLDTNKLDPFASYPMVQTLAPPGLPTKKASPSVAIALIGAMAATFLIFIAFGLLWLRQPILDKALRRS